MLAAKSCMAYLVDNEAEIYSTLAEMGAETRRVVTDAFADEGISVRFAGDRSKILPQSSLHMLLFPFKEGLALNSPQEVRNPEICDLELTEKVVQLALLLEDVHVVHGLGSTTTAHSDEELHFLSAACQRVARRIKPYL
jgi:glutamate-1-semialdehyde aminotransferase